MSNKERTVLCMLNTGIVVEYTSAKEASKALGVSLTGVRDCLRGARNTSGGCRFEYGDLESYQKDNSLFFAKVEPLKTKKRTPVVVFNPDTSVFGYYENVSCAARAINSAVSKVRDCARGKANTVNGFVIQECSLIEFKIKSAKYVLPKKHGKNFPVVQLTCKGEEVARFNSVGEAANASHHFDRAAISKCVNKKLKTAYGFKWMFLDEYVLSRENHKRS